MALGGNECQTDRNERRKRMSGCESNFHKLAQCVITDKWDKNKTHKKKIEKSKILV